jgi:hypothetical protein
MPRTETTKLAAALARQADNMAFVLNRVPMPDDWYEKFQNELVEDRQVLNAGI